MAARNGQHDRANRSKRTTLRTGSFLFEPTGEIAVRESE